MAGGVKQHSRLLPCPFCGAEGKHLLIENSSGHSEANGYNFIVTVHCPCGVRVIEHSHKDQNGWCKDSTEEVIRRLAEKWNARVAA